MMEVERGRWACRSGAGWRRVRAYAIQATNTGDDKTTVLEQATAAYQKYVNQNKGQAGGVTK